MKSMHTLILLGALGLGSSALAARFDDARGAFENKRWDEAVKLLTEEIAEHPGHVEARILLSQAHEELKQWSQAQAAWEAVSKVAATEAQKDIARRGLIRVKRQEAELSDVGSIMKTAEAESSYDFRKAFAYELPPINWEEVETVESTKYVGVYPPFHYATKNFDVYTTNEKLSKVVGERCELYLKFMTDRLFGGRAWGFRVPVMVYATRDDYINVGGAPASSAGVTFGDTLHGKSRKVLIYHRTKVVDDGGSEQEVMYKYAIDGILPHELTHVMINEFFGGQETPQWLHEAVAERMSQMRDHYLEAARMARAVVAGEHFRLRDLFEQEGYPNSRVTLFYLQSASVVTYLFEAGPEAMYVFLSELAQQHTHDQALAASLGIPEQNAVEQFEKMWVEWMKRRYITDLRPDVGEIEEAMEIDAVKNAMAQAPVDEVAAAEAVTEWRTIATDSLSKDFCGVGETLEDWSASNGVLKSVVHDNPEVASYLGVKIHEKRPMALKCTFRMDGAAEGQAWAGFALLDAANEDTGIQVLAPMTDGTDHTMLAILGDELAIYVDGVCTGRRPAPVLRRREASADFPLAFVSYGPLQVSNIQVARVENMKSFNPKPLEATGDQATEGSEGQPPPASGGRGRGRGRR